MQAGEREARSEGRTTASRGGFLLLHLLNIIRARYTPVIRVSFVSGSQYASRATLAGFSRSFAFDLTLQNAEATKSKICFGMHVNILLTNNPPTHPPHPQNLGGEGDLQKKPSATEKKTTTTSAARGASSGWFGQAPRPIQDRTIKRKPRLRSTHRSSTPEGLSTGEWSASATRQ